MSARLPMFPLGTVLPPYGLLPLHVFEPRYRVLVFDCLRGDREFGVVLIERGSDVGGDDQRFGVATVAKIVDAQEFPDGRWLLLVVGGRRVDVVEWQADDPYPVALVEERAEYAWPEPRTVAAAEARHAFTAAVVAVKRALALAVEIGAADKELATALLDLSDDREVAAWQLVAAAPIESLDKQRLLAIDDPAVRLPMLTVLAEDQALLLAYRLTGE